MKLSIPFSEIAEIIKARSGREVVLAQKDEKTIAVEYVMKMALPLVGEISKSFGADLRLVGIEGERVHLKYEVCGALNMAIRGGLALFPEYANQKYFTVDGNDVTVHLDAIENVHEALQRIDVKSVEFVPEGAVAEFSVKL